MSWPTFVPTVLQRRSHAPPLWYLMLIALACSMSRLYYEPLKVLNSDHALPGAAVWTAKHLQPSLQLKVER